MSQTTDELCDQIADLREQLSRERGRYRAMLAYADGFLDSVIQHETPENLPVLLEKIRRVMAGGEQYQATVKTGENIDATA